MRDFDAIWLNARLLRLATDSGLDIDEEAAIAVREGQICWIGPVSSLPTIPFDIADETFDCGGRLITPALIDCHTHLIFAGSRAAEFEARLKGRSYTEIAAAGGGIMSTVRATREANEDALVEAALPRLKALMRDGVGTVEIKSGYGLDLRTEIRMLRAVRRLGRELDLRVKASYLGLHAVPPEFDGRADDYVEFVTDEVLPEIARQRLADYVDAYLETIAFDAGQVRRVFDRCGELDLPVRLHADQLSNTNGAALAAAYGALTADHLEFTDTAGVEALADAGSVAVLLPGAFLCLGETQRPPVGTLRAEGVPMAVATDANPGTSPILSLRLAMSLACLEFGLTVEESIRGVTEVAAAALGIEDEAGRLKTGMAADFVIWNTSEPADLCYWLGGDLMDQLVIAGHAVED